MPNGQMVKMEELAPGIMLFHNVFTDAQEYLNNINSSNLTWKTAQVLMDQSSESISNYHARDTDLLVLPAIDEDAVNSDPLSQFSKEFYKNIMPLVDEYKNFYNAKTEKMEKPQLLRYGQGQHFYNHVDDHPFLTRRISMTFYINDDYAGGDVEFPRFDLRVKSKASQLLIFPSNFIYNHMVHDVTSGTRYSVVQWIA